MSGEFLEGHFDALVEDIRTLNVREARDIVTADQMEVERLRETNPRLAGELMSIVQDEDHLRVAVESCCNWARKLPSQRQAS